MGKKMKQRALDTPAGHSLLDVPTSALADELEQRDGVMAFEIGPMGRGAVDVPGPATVLVVID